MSAVSVAAEAACPMKSMMTAIAALAIGLAGTAAVEAATFQVDYEIDLTVSPGNSVFGVTTSDTLSATFVIDTSINRVARIP